MVGVVTVCLAIAHKRVEAIPPQELVRIPRAFKSAIEGINIVGINVVYDGLDDPQYSWRALPQLIVLVRDSAHRAKTQYCRHSVA